MNHILQSVRPVAAAVGFHSHVSQAARHFWNPGLVCKSHSAIRDASRGRNVKTQSTSRSRDNALQGSVNPNLGDFGDRGEVSQYFGPEVEAGRQRPVNFWGPQ